MQTSKTRAGALEVPQRTSRKLKTSGSDLDNASSLSLATRSSFEHSPKVGRRSPRTPTSEKKRPGKVSELESHVAQLEDELKNTKDQLSQAESSKSQAHREAEEAKKQLALMSAKLDGLLASDDSMDTAALVSAINEILKLKVQQATEPEAAESGLNEIGSLKIKLSETLDLVEDLKTQLNDCKDSESRASEVVNLTRKQLETLGSEKLSLATELQQTKAELEELKAKLAEKDAKFQNFSTKNNESIGSDKEKDFENGTKTKRLESDLEGLKRVLFDKETKVAEVTEHMAAAEAANAELEAEMQRLKVQSDQWRKAAEVAAAMLSGGNSNGKFGVDSNTVGGKLNSGFCEEMEDESAKKRNGNMLKKIGVLLKKK